jgi:hypothetical protein
LLKSKGYFHKQKNENPKLLITFIVPKTLKKEIGPEFVQRKKLSSVTESPENTKKGKSD